MEFSKKACVLNTVGLRGLSKLTLKIYELVFNNLQDDILSA